MTQLHTKNELWFALLWIGVYVIGFSLADSLSLQLGTEKLVTAAFGILLSLLLAAWLRRQGLLKQYGLCAVQGNLRDYLWFLPLVIIVSTNLWLGVTMNLPVTETVLYIISMICVGFLEELIFRGFLFRAIAKSNLKQAIHISAVTFGIGHIVNLLNGAPMLSTLLQVCYAVAAGYLFTLLFLKSGSLIPCILAHSTINSLSVFAPTQTDAQDILMAAVLIILNLGYTLWILKKVPDQALDL